MQSAAPMLYNYNAKLKYIKYENTNPQILINYFTRVAKKEYEYDRDIAEMTAEELKETIASLKIRRSDTRAHIISALRGYASWARQNGRVRDTAAMDALDPDGFDTREINLNHMVRSPEHLRGILGECLDYVNCPNTSVKYELYCWLLYAGLTIDEIRVLRKEAIDKERQVIVTGVREYAYGHIEEPLVRLWEQCASMTHIEKKNNRYSAENAASREYIKMELVDNENMFRPMARGNRNIHEEYMSMVSFMTLTKKILGSRENMISANNIRISGLYYKLYRAEREGAELTNEVFAENFGIKYTDNLTLRNNTRRYRIDYDDWKRSFDL